jgi:hypothetical protein
MISTSELGMLFRQGANRGVASRTTIVEGKNFTYLVDYGWAVLAKRSKRTGEILYYSGWYGYSPTTSKHISQLGLRSADFVSKKAKKLGEMV